MKPKPFKIKHFNTLYYISTRDDRFFYKLIGKQVYGGFKDKNHDLTWINMGIWSKKFVNLKRISKKELFLKLL